MSKSQLAWDGHSVRGLSWTYALLIDQSVRSKQSLYMNRRTVVVQHSFAEAGTIVTNHRLESAFFAIQDASEPRTRDKDPRADSDCA